MRWSFINDLSQRKHLAELEESYELARANPSRPSDLISIQNTARKEQAEWSALLLLKVAPASLRLDPLRPWSEVLEDVKLLVGAYQTLLECPSARAHVMVEAVGRLTGRPTPELRPAQA
jgi:hypothetical protein